MSISHVLGALATYPYAVKAQKTSAKEITFDDKVTETVLTVQQQRLMFSEEIQTTRKIIIKEK